MSKQHKNKEQILELVKGKEAEVVLEAIREVLYGEVEIHGDAPELHIGTLRETVGYMLFDNYRGTERNDEEMEYYYAADILVNQWLDGHYNVMYYELPEKILNND